MYIFPILIININICRVFAWRSQGSNATRAVNASFGVW